MKPRSQTIKNRIAYNAGWKAYEISPSNTVPRIPYAPETQEHLHFQRGWTDALDWHTPQRTLESGDYESQEDERTRRWLQEQDAIMACRIDDGLFDEDWGQTAS